MPSSGTPQVVVGQVRQPLEPAHEVVGQEADQAAGQRRQVAAGRPARRPASSRTVSRSTSTGSPVGRHARRRGAEPERPGRRARSAWRRCARRRTSSATTPCRRRPAPCSADSSRKVPGPPASLRYTPTGVSPSASSRRVTGTTRRVPGQFVEGLLVGGDDAGGHWTLSLHGGRSMWSWKQVRAPVWQAAPTWSTLTSRASPSQSSATDLTYWWCPEVSPFTQSVPTAARPVGRPAGGERAVQRLVVHPGQHEHLAGVVLLDDGGHEPVGVAPQTGGDGRVERVDGRGHSRRFSRTADRWPSRPRRSRFGV